MFDLGGIKCMFLFLKSVVMIVVHNTIKNALTTVMGQRIGWCDAQSFTFSFPLDSFLHTFFLYYPFELETSRGCWYIRIYVHV